MRPSLRSFWATIRISCVALLLPVATTAQPTFTGPSFLPGDGALSPAASDQETPQLALGGTQILAVWADSRTNFTSLPPFIEQQGARDVYAARLDGNGAPIDQFPIIVNESFGYQRNPLVAWNGQNWLVVWENQSPTQYYYATEILAARIAPDGAVLDPSPISVVGYQNSSSAMFSVTSNGSDWLVVVQGTSSGEGGILGVRIGADGSVLDPTPAVLVPSTYFLYFNITVHHAQSEYLLVYKASAEFKADRFQDDLTPAGSFTPPSLLVASNGTGYFTVWDAAGTFVGSQMTSAGVLESPGGVPIVTIAASETDLAWDGTNWWFSWWNAGIGIAAARISPAGTVLDPGGVPVNPAVAGQMRQHRIAGEPNGGLQVAWKDFRSQSALPYDIFGAFFSAGGAVQPDRPLSQGSPAQRQSDLCPGPDGFLAVYRSDVSGVHRIVAQRVSGTGAALDSEPVLVAESPSLGPPHVDWDGSRFMVVWEDGTQVYGRRLQADLSFIDAAPLNIMEGASPDVAALNGVFLVVATQPTISIHFFHPFSMRVDGATGNLLDTAPVILGQYFARYPRVIAFGNRWFAAWQRNFSHDDPLADLVGAFIEQDGTTPGQFLLSGGFTPDIATSGGTALVVFRTGTEGNAQQDIRGLRVLPDGTLLDGLPGFIITDLPEQQFNPSVAWDGSRFLVTWEDQRNAAVFFDERSDIYAMRVQEDGTILDPGGFPLVTSPLPETDPAVASAGGNTLVAVSHFVDQQPFSAYRIGLHHTPGTVMAPPQAAFTAGPISGCGPLAVSFTDQSTGDVTRWDWLFGDGGTSSEQHPTHTYTAPGSYTVALIAGGSGGANAFVRSGLVTVPEPVGAAFSASTTVGCSPLTVDFADLSTGNPTAWAWTFGDGGVSSDQNPTHTFQTPGTFIVTLTASGTCGTDQEIKAGYIQIAEPCGIVATALQDLPVTGTVSGDYTKTFANDFTYETITEVESSGNPSSRYSLLEHRWRFDVAPGPGVTLHLDTYRPSSGDGDNFTIEYSTDNVIYIPVATLDVPGYKNQSLPLPASLNGPVYVRVADTDHNPGNLAMDVVYIDRIMIETDGTVATGIAVDERSGLPEMSVYPNPCLSGRPVDIRFSLKEAAAVGLDIFDLQGKRVHTQAAMHFPAGENSLAWDGKDDRGRDVSPGVYFARIRTGTSIRSVKMIRRH